MTSNITLFAMSVGMSVGEMLVGGDPAEIAEARQRAARALPAILGFAVGCGPGGRMSPRLACGRSLCQLALRCSRFLSDLPRQMRDDADKPASSRLQIAVLCASGLAEEGLSHLDVAEHSNLRVALQRFAE
jgi:hypothetical protein